MAVFQEWSSEGNQYRTTQKFEEKNIICFISCEVLLYVQYGDSCQGWRKPNSTWASNLQSRRRSTWQSIALVRKSVAASPVGPRPASFQLIFWESPSTRKLAASVLAGRGRNAGGNFSSHSAASRRTGTIFGGRSCASSSSNGNIAASGADACKAGYGCGSRCCCYSRVGSDDERGTEPGTHGYDEDDSAATNPTTGVTANMSLR